MFNVQGMKLECVVSHPAYLEGDGSTHVEIDVLCKYHQSINQSSLSALFF